jgi:predicted Rossmann fold flavoprotein
LIYDAAIIGGGAAGLFCAITAARRGRRVVVLEHNAELGRKILISGGGRCNFTNTGTTPENFISRNPHFARSALAGYTPEDFVELVKKHHIPFFEKKLGQLFCRDSSRAIVEMLIAECRDARVEVRTGCSVTAVDRTEVFNVETGTGRVSARQLVVACGGRSFPKIGATDLGYRLARQFGLEMTATRPSLVALVMSRPLPQLAGISADAEVRVGKRRFRENILCTHRGLSGPATLQASNYWQPEGKVHIDLLPDVDPGEMLHAMASSRQTDTNFLSEYLPRRLAESFASDRQVPQMSKAAREDLVHGLKNWEVTFRDTEGWDRAEVTLGGVETGELSSKTMEARRVPGLYFIGEVVDVTGWLGGSNFQWAWASGFAAGSVL